MPIFGSDGGLVGSVDSVLGMRIVLKRDGGEAEPHYIPLSWVANVTDRVTLDCPAAQARPASATAVPDQAKRPRVLGPAIWATAGVAAVLLAYIGSTLIPRGSAPAVDKPAPVASATAPSATPAVTATPLPKPATAAATGPVPANPQSIAEFLNSDKLTPALFSLDSVPFAPGSATLTTAAAKAVGGIAEVMRMHVNTKIKLAVAPDGGAVALRRAEAIRAALIARGVASYRIAMGPTRGRGRSGSGVELVILAK